MAKKLAQIIDNHFELKKNNIVYIDGDYTKFHVVKFFGDILSTYDDTSTLREDWNYYNSIHGEDFIRLLDGFMEDYNPIENYDRYEDTNVTFDKGQQTDQIISTSKTAHTENKVSAFDTEGYSNSSKIDNTQDGFTDSSVNGSREDKTDTTSHIHGNIGVTTNAQMLSGEALIRYNNLVDKYIDRWVQSVIVGYDEGYVDTTPSYDDYATKAELNAVKNDVNDLEESVDSITSSVNALGQTVAAATADITTLYSQTDNLRTDLNGVDDIVQSTVADVEELQTEVEDLSSKVEVHEATFDHMSVNKHNNIVVLTLTPDVTLISGSAQQIGTIPEGFRPKERVIMSTKVFNGSQYVDCVLRLYADGRILVNDFFSNNIANVRPQYIMTTVITYTTA